MTCAKNPKKTLKFVKNASGALFEIISSRPFLLRNWSPFQSRRDSFESMSIVGSVIRSKSLAYTKFIIEFKIWQTYFGVHSLERFAADTRSFRRNTAHLSRFVQKGWSYEVKVWPILKFLAKLKADQKRLGVYFLEIFAADTKSFKVKRFTSKKLVILSEETQFIWADSDRRVDNYEVKVWSILKFIKNLKNCLRFFGVHSLELFAADTRCFQVKTLSSK